MMKYFIAHLLVAIVLCAILGHFPAETKQKVTDVLGSSNPPIMSHWFAGVDESSTVAISKKKKSTPPPPLGCETFGDCRNCFCDSLCWMFDDCCRSYLSDKSEVLGPRLSSMTFTCQRLPGYFDYVDNYSGPIYVISKCSDSFPVGYLRDGCERGSMLAEPSVSEQFYAIPVSSRTSGLVYRNLFCALCHGELNTTFWTVSRQCYSSDGEQDQLDKVSLATLVTNESALNDCETVYKMPRGIKPRRCVDSINTCPSDVSESMDSALCQQENATLFVYTPNGAPYRNKHCAACYGYDVSSLLCERPTGTDMANRHTIVNDVVPSFSVILDLNTGRGFVHGHSERLGVCPELSVYDPFAGMCRVITCPSGQIFDREGVCRSDVAQENLGDVGVMSMKVEEDSGSVEWCPLISLNVSEYRMLENGSIFVEAYEKLYNRDQYRLDDENLRTNESNVLICSPFTDRNYTEPLDASATLELDVIGGYLSIVCSVISLIALAFQFGVYMLFSVLRNRPGQLVLCLIVSLFVGQLLFLLVNQSSGSLCYIQAVLMHYSFLAAFLWMNVMAIDVYRTFGTSAVSAMLASPSAGFKRFVGYSLYSWGLTGLIVVTAVVMDQLDIGGEYRPHYGLHFCWFGSRPSQMVFFATPLGVVLVANIALFVGSVVQIHKASKATRIAVQKPANVSLMMIYAKLSVVMGLGWMIGFLATFTKWSPLWYIFIVCNSLQGAFICIAFVITKQVIRLLSEYCRSQKTSTSDYVTSSTVVCSTGVTQNKTSSV